MKDRTGPQIRKLFGQPDFVRKDGPSQLWRYSAKKCTLELFMFQAKGATSALIVSHFEMRPRDGAEMSERICMAEIALSR